MTPSDGKGHTPGWVWLALPLGAIGALIFAQSLDASPAATRRRPGALTHLVAARAHAAAAVPEPAASEELSRDRAHHPSPPRPTAEPSALAVGLSLVAIVAACGQKPGTHNAAKDALPEIIVQTGSARRGPRSPRAPTAAPWPPTGGTTGGTTTGGTATAVARPAATGGGTAAPRR